jgi:hypothetical protein
LRGHLSISTLMLLLVAGSVGPLRHGNKRRQNFSLLTLVRLAFLTGGLALLTSCAGKGPAGKASSTLSSFAVRGIARGGQQPITGATIQLYAAGTAGDGSASTPLLGIPAQTDSLGSFQISSEYTCPSPTAEVYLTASSGNPGLPSGANNAAIIMMAALGQCGSLTASTFVTVDEVTTIGSLAALYPYASSVSQLGSGSGDAAELATAFALVNEYVNIATGTTPGPALPAGSDASSLQINTLADILATCVNSSGGAAGDGSLCGNLFALATPQGGSAPIDILGATLDILNNPSQNAAALFNLIGPNAPFQPFMSTAPTSWALSITAAPGSPVISSFNASASQIGVGSSATLSWNVANASSIAITPGSFSTSTLVGSTTVSPNLTTVYTITATNGSGTNTATTTVEVDSIPPAIPANLAPTATGTSTISLTWTGSTDVGGPGLAGYNIYRCTGPSCTPSTIVGTSATASYADTGLTPSTSYTYTVAADDTLGLASAMSSPASATTADATTATSTPVPFAAYSSGTDDAYYQAPISAVTSPSLIMYPKTPGGSIGGANNCLLVPIYSAVGLTQSAPTDNMGDTYSEGPSVTDSGNITLTLWYVLGAPAGVTTITEATSGSSFGMGWLPITALGGWIVEAANCNGSSVGGNGTLDTSATGSALTLTLSSAPSTGDMPIGFFIDSSIASDIDYDFPVGYVSSITAGSGYTARTNSLTFGKFAEYATTTTSTSMQFTPSGSDTWLGVGIDIQSGPAGNVPSGKFIDTWQEEQFPGDSTDALDFPCMGNTIAVEMTAGDNFISSITGSSGTWSAGEYTTGDAVSQIAYGTGVTCNSTTTVTPAFDSPADNPGTSVTLVSMSNMISAIDTGSATSNTSDATCSETEGFVQCYGGSGSNSAINLLSLTPSETNEVVLIAGSISQHTANTISTDANSHTPQGGYAVDTDADDAFDDCDGSTSPNTLSEDNPFGLLYNTDTLPETFIFGGTWVTAGGLGNCLNDPTGASDWTAVGAAFN